ncbi:sensor histidine kinase [Sphingomonas sp. PAMC 26621]|uniref:sensor histidine kinase n=1 Tax=Sphingomonas sp. PAMC 26621 TaxID=1112213 RepID=UPI000287CC83|nr:histidine kinase [Sphingomonas sp. PAMC 26621]
MSDQANFSRMPFRFALLSVLGFWSVWLVLVTARAVAMGWPDQGGMLLRRCGLVALGIVLTLLIHLALHRLRLRSVPIRATTAFLLAAPATIVFATINTFVFYRWFPVPSVAGDLARWDPQAVIVTSIADGLVTWYFFFAAWAAFYLAIGHIAEVRAAEHAAAAAAAESREARLAMLRLQVDPHFLFNALNALSSLVARGETRAAREMIGNLAAFFRAGLGAELTGDIPLADEIELQRLYLAIEQARFGDRLLVEWDMPSELENMPVLPMILQPLVENAVKYGVARTAQPVTITIAARRTGNDTVVLSVDDTGSIDAAMPFPAAGTGIGLANVRARLATRYGAASLLSAAATSGGWRSAITVPARG